MKSPPDPQPIDESLLRWKVWSFTNRREKDELLEYLVELKTEHGFPNCSCPHFQNRIKPKYAQAVVSGIPYADIERVTCKHIKLAEEHFKTLMLEAMYKRECDSSFSC